MMIEKRIYTALLLVGGLILALMQLSPESVSLLFLAIAAAGAWEWAALAGWSSRLLRSFLVALFLGVCLYYTSVYAPDITSDAVSMRPVLGIACFVWLATAFLVLSYPKLSVLWRSSVVRGVMGIFVLGAGWLSLTFLLGLQHGWLLVILFVLTVAVADIGAYFIGHALGKNPLAPDVSPAKTIEGLWGGLLLSRRGPTIAAINKAASPAVSCTTIPPAKSLTPVSPKMPPSAIMPPPQTQCTTGA